MKDTKNICRVLTCILYYQFPCQEESKSLGIKSVLLQRKTVCELQYVLFTECTSKSFLVHFTDAATLKRHDYLPFQHCHTLHTAQ